MVQPASDTVEMQQTAEEAERRGQARQLRSEIARLQRQLLRLEGALPSHPSMDVTELGASDSEGGSEGDASGVCDMAQAASFLTGEGEGDGVELGAHDLATATKHTAYSQV